MKQYKKHSTNNTKRGNYKYTYYQNTQTYQTNTTKNTVKTIEITVNTSIHITKIPKLTKTPTHYQNTHTKIRFIHKVKNRLQGLCNVQ